MVPLDQHRCTESRPDSRYHPADALTSFTERRVTVQSWADVNGAQLRTIAVVAVAVTDALVVRRY